jgi:hypothetical protein
MEPILPGEIRVADELDGTRYVLPKRRLGKAGRTVGIVLVAFGLFATAFMLFWMGMPISEGLGEEGAIRWPLILFGLLGLPGLVVAVCMVVVGISLLCNLSHSEVFVTRESLVSVERAGFLRWRRRRSLDAIDSLVISEALEVKDDSGRRRTIFGDDVGGLRVEGAAIKPMWIAPAYPLEVVHKLSEMLVDSVDARVGGLLRRAEDEIAVVTEKPGEGADDELFEQPDDSNAVLQQLEDGVAVTIPPRGVWKGSKGLFFFSLAWNGIVLLIVSVMFFAAGKDPPPWPAWLFLGFFVAVGVGFFLAAVNMGTRRALLAAAAGTFAFRRSGIFGTRERRWRAGEIRAIRVGSSGMEVNDAPVLELQVVPREGRKIGLFSERSDDELRWIATLLRRELGVPSESD